MKQISSIWSGLTKTILIKSGRKADADGRREATDALVKEAKKNDMILRSPGVVIARDLTHLTSVFSKGGKKGVNQDCFIVWEEFGFQEDIVFGGIFDGHGPWGHLVSKRVRKLMPSLLLCNWQETLSGSTPGKSDNYHIWKQAFFRTYSAIDQDLKRQNRIDTFHSGTTALTFVMQGNHIVIANIGDSRAVLATTDDDGSLLPVQLTVDLKPNLPQEASRIRQSKGRVFSAEDEPGIYRVWMPPNNGSSGPGLAISRAFGDYFIKDFGLISDPEFTVWNINTTKDHFIILATDGVWDVLSNEEAVKIVSSSMSEKKKEESAKRLVECAVNAWKQKKRGFAMDDISAICLFFQSTDTKK